MDVQRLLNDLKSIPEMDPDKHDGCYELMRDIVKAYSNLDRLDNCTFKDLNAIYAMALGTWKLNVEKKKEYVNATCLTSSDKAKINKLIDIIWDNACYNKYENRENGKPSIGLFGTGFYFFSAAEDERVKDFIQMLIDIKDQQDDETIYEIVSNELSKGFKGMGAASASIILHCLKPFTFPILNGNAGYGNLYEKIGVEIEQPGKITTYIENCRRIKQFRDNNLPFKNYRILDKWAWKLDEYEDDEHENNGIKENEILKSNSLLVNYPHNLILYGPPGTGKTYNTILYSVAIIEDKLYDDIRKESVADFESVKARYDNYRNSGRVALTTFHQSYGYEEFIEGIRPVMEDEESNSDSVSGSDLKYSIKSGIFKQFCEKADIPETDKNIFNLNDNPSVWKVSLAGANDNPIREECLLNSHIRIGWDEYGENIFEDTDYKFGGRNPLNAFINRMRVGDIVLSCYSSTVIDAIGVITGDYRWDDSFSYYKRVRDVKWIVKNIREDIYEINNRASMTLSTVYKMKITVSEVMKLIRKNIGSGDDRGTIRDKYVFVIDEINRGNISKIFGELITLIEETKRKGEKEATEVILPYSGKSFGIPSNVYIVGTMNTADRSIALMDTALRRRFSFVEMMPETTVLQELGISKIGDLDLIKMLQTINERITYLYDREHTIGHAFFTGLKDDPTVEQLGDIFLKKIIPLLQEYFYEDYHKIQLVLGDNSKSDERYMFIKEIPIEENLFKGWDDDSYDIHEKKYVINKGAFKELQSYIEII